MDPLLLSFTALHVLSIALIIISLLSIIALERRTSSAGWSEQVSLDRRLQARGALHGPLMAIAIFTGLGLYYYKAGGFTWDPDTEWGALHLLKLALFLPTWVHWGWQEVVVMDGVRKHWPEEGQEPSDAYKAGHRKVYRSLALLVLELMCVVGVGVVAGLSATP